MTQIGQCSRKSFFFIHEHPQKALLVWMLGNKPGWEWRRKIRSAFEKTIKCKKQRRVFEDESLGQSASPPPPCHLQMYNGSQGTAMCFCVKSLFKSQRTFEKKARASSLLSVCLERLLDRSCRIERERLESARGEGGSSGEAEGDRGSSCRSGWLLFENDFLRIGHKLHLTISLSKIGVHKSSCIKQAKCPNPDNSDN